MQPDTAQKLIHLNRQFYQTFALQFSATRQRIQPGVRQVIERLPNHLTLLDLGCGNGELWRVLAGRGFAGRYVGLDFSAELLNEARKTAQEQTAGQAVFLQADLSDAGWEARLLEQLSALAFLPTPEAADRPFGAIFAFAVLHHLPGRSLHREVLEKVRRLLAPGGQFIHSEWQFLNSPRLRGRIQPWEEFAPALGIDPADLDPNDYLLDWRQGGAGLRYVHHFDEAELAALAAETGFQIRDTFYSDGEGGRLGLYQIWMEQTIESI